MPGPFDNCAACDHDRLYHEGGGKCQFPRVDPTGNPTPCSCETFVEPKKKS